MSTIERRVIQQGTSVRTSGGTDGKPLAIEGIAAPFNTYADLGGFRERILPGAFAKALRSVAKGKSDIACLFNHDPNYVLGRMSNRMLSAEEVSSGLSFRCLLDDGVTTHRDVAKLIENRSITGCSFGFGCAPDGSDELWDEGFADGLGLDSEDEEDDDEPSRSISVKGQRFVRRTIKKFSLITDIGPVTFPAYVQGTSVNSRSTAGVVDIPATAPAEFRSMIMANREKPVIVAPRFKYLSDDNDLLSLVL